MKNTEFVGAFCFSYIQTVSVKVFGASDICVGCCGLHIEQTDISGDLICNIDQTVIVIYFISAKVIIVNGLIQFVDIASANPKIEVFGERSGVQKVGFLVVLLKGEAKVDILGEGSAQLRTELPIFSSGFHVEGGAGNCLAKPVDLKAVLILNIKSEDII